MAGHKKIVAAPSSSWAIAASTISARGVLSIIFCAFYAAQIKSLNIKGLHANTMRSCDCYDIHPNGSKWHEAPGSALVQMARRQDYQLDYPPLIHHSKIGKLIVSRQVTHACDLSVTNTTSLFRSKEAIKKNHYNLYKMLEMFPKIARLLEAGRPPGCIFWLIMKLNYHKFSSSYIDWLYLLKCVVP